MGITDRLSKIRDQIINDLSAPGRDMTLFFYGAENFTPITEIAVGLMQLIHKSTGKYPDHREFRNVFVALIACEKPGDFAIETWGLLRTDALRLEALLAKFAPLPETFTHLVYSRDELTELPPKQVISLLYRIYLDRTPEESGLKDWTEKINAGTAIEDVVYAIAGSDEASIKKTGRTLTVLESISPEMLPFLISYRSLQELELCRLYDFARLILLISS